MNRRLGRALLCGCALWGGLALHAQPIAPATNILGHPLSRAGAVEAALQRNAAILKGKADLDAAHGVAIQLRSIVYPALTVAGAFNAEQSTLIENFPIPAPFPQIRFPNKNWNADVKVQQVIYEGGRLRSSLRSAKLTREQALLNFQTVLADTLLSVRVTYDDALAARQDITVHEASVKLLGDELADVVKRNESGQVPKLDVLRARVELANEKPRLIQARNAYRIAKNNLLNLLGCDLPPSAWEDVPLELSDTLEAAPLEVDLPAALIAAGQNRPELAALKTAESLRREDVIQARAGRLPMASVFGGYQWQSLPYKSDLDDDLYGWTAGAQLTWSIFDGGYTRGKIMEAEAHHARARLDVDDTRRQIELEVRTAHSNFIEAKELLDSQKTVQEEAEEALRLAEVRAGAGTATQLDVLSAQTALTQARTTQTQALHDYSTARARLQRAMGGDMEIVQK